MADAARILEEAHHARIYPARKLIKTPFNGDRRRAHPARQLRVAKDLAHIMTLATKGLKASTSTV